MKKLVELVYNTKIDEKNWTTLFEEAINELFGQPGGRYPERAAKLVKTRAPFIPGENGISFGALIHPSNPDSGAYGGLCFVIFPQKDEPCLICMGVGTQGLSPDDDILSRPGHARKVSALCGWINSFAGKKNMVAWAKLDPVRVDIDIPSNIKSIFEKYDSIFKKYGRVLHGIFSPTKDKDSTEKVLKAFLDLMFEERGIRPLTVHEKEYEKIRSDYFSFLMPSLEDKQVVELLEQRKYVILEGPPGTGKSRMAGKILKDVYNGNGLKVQFHPGTTYETFVGGLAPEKTAEGMGFKFSPVKGVLMEAVEGALSEPRKPFLLYIDEINRTDLAKVLGEAIYLFEPDEENRSIAVPYDFGGAIKTKLVMPKNLHVLGTMNSADRSIAIVDVAIRRRFAFVKLWPQMDVVLANSGNIMQEAFKKTTAIFIENASDDSFSLVPGHSYYLGKDDTKAPRLLNVHLLPLLEEYLAQGYVANFADSVRGHIQWIKSLIANETKT